MKYCSANRNGTIIELYDSASALPPGWGKLLPEGHFLKPSHLAANERMAIPDVHFIYVLVLWKEQPVAAAYFQVLSVKEYHLATQSLGALQAFGWRMFTKLLHPRLLVAGHLFRHDISSFYCVDEVSAFDAFHIYRSVIENAMAKSKAMATLVKDMPETLIPYFNRYAPEYLLLPNDIAMQMDLPAQWQTMHDYEKALKHKYAQRFRKIRALRGALEIKELSAEDTEREKEVLYGLYRQVSNRQQVRLGFLSVDFLPVLKKEHEDRLHVWMAYEGGKPVGFFSAWATDDAFDMFYIGFDYERKEALQLYFNILYFSIEQAIDFKKRKLILGRTALEAKARLGCKPKYLSTFLYIRNGLLRKAINGIQNNVATGEGEWENRHPFK